MQPHEAKIRKAGKVLWVFSWIWLVFNSLACLFVIGAVIVFYFFGAEEGFKELMIGSVEVPGLDRNHLEAILSWDYASFQNHFWLTLFYITAAFVVYLVSMIFILKIAAAWKKCDVFGEVPIRNLRLLGWVALIHGIIGNTWGMLGSYIGESNTCSLIYYSFLRDTCLYSFYMNGSGIEWGLLALMMSWILKHAQLIRADQELVV